MFTRFKVKAKYVFFFLLALVAMAAIVFCVASCVESDDNSSSGTSGVKYQLSSDKSYAIVTGITSNATSVTIASTYSGKTVKEIAANAFEGNTNIVSITIPSSVTSIGSGAFSYCTSLTSLSIPNGVTVVEQILCWGCTSLKTVTLPSSVTSIAFGAFMDCTSLTSISLPSKLTSVGAETFSGCTSLKSVTVPDNATIGEYAFEGCAFTEFTVPAGTKTIEMGVFNNCKSLQRVLIPTTVTTISNYAFNGCSSLSAVYFYGTNGSSSLTYGQNNSAYANATKFYYSENPPSSETKGNFWHYVNGTITSWDMYLLTLDTQVNTSEETTCSSNSAYYAAGYTETISAPAAYSGYSISWYLNNELVSTGSSYTFVMPAQDSVLLLYIADSSGDTSSDPADNPSSVFSSVEYKIYSNSYATVTGVSDNSTEIIIADTYNGYPVTQIETSAFENNSSIESVVIGKNITQIGTAAFRNCSSLTEIHYNAKSVSDLYSTSYVFYAAGQGSTGITLTVGSDVEKIPAYLFYTNSYSTGYEPNIVCLEFEAGSVCTEIRQYAFYRCTPLVCVEIPNSVTKLGTFAFYYCTSMQKLSIGHDLTTVEYDVFYQTTALTEIYFNAVSMPDLTSAFTIFESAGTNGDGISVTIGVDVNRIPAYLFNGYTVPKITSIVFEDGCQCTEIGGHAFTNCKYLAYVTIPDSVTSIGDYAFNGATVLTNIVLSEGLTEIGDYAFYQNTSITDLIIPDNVTTIGAYAFYGCSSLKNLTIGASITSISTYAFYNCTALEEIKFNATAMSDLGLSNRVFEYAGTSGNGITVVVGSNVTEIPSYLFCPFVESYSSPKVTTLIFAENSQCTSIGDYAFNNCTALQNIYYSGTSEDWATITKGSNNDPISSATIYYYSVNEPSDDGNFWHYADGEIVIWSKEYETAPNNEVD